MAIRSRHTSIGKPKRKKEPKYFVGNWLVVDLHIFGINKPKALQLKDVIHYGKNKVEYKFVDGNKVYALNKKFIIKKL